MPIINVLSEVMRKFEVIRTMAAFEGSHIKLYLHLPNKYYTYMGLKMGGYILERSLPFARASKHRAEP